MQKVKITAIRRSEYKDLSAIYENPIQNACDIEIGQSFISENAERPEGLCQSAWESMYPFVKALAEGGGNFYGGWMKNPKSAMISCNDGFRPVSFYIEVVMDIDYYERNTRELYEAKIVNEGLADVQSGNTVDGGQVKEMLGKKYSI